MRILIADDDAVSRRVLEATLKRWGYEVVVARDGGQAWSMLETDPGLSLAILDWMMPGMDGLEVCERARKAPATRSVYILMLTARGRREDLVAGLQAGANDYVTKPFDQEELKARVQVGVRVVELQRVLAERVRELEEALSQVKQLGGLLPICSYCKKVRDDQNYWHAVDNYLSVNGDMHFSHGICPDCYEKVAVPQMQLLRDQGPSD